MNLEYDVESCSLYDRKTKGGLIPVSRLNQKKFLSTIIDKKYETKEISKYRKALLQNVVGEILEVGIGTGANLAYYPKTVTHITGVDEIVRELRSQHPKVEHYYSKFTELPFETNTFDTVVATFAMSHMSDLELALMEIKRVLKPRGRLIFLDHGQAVQKSNDFLQNVVDPLWEVTIGGRLNRNYFEELKKLDFLLANEVRTESSISLKSMIGTLYMGIAVNVK